MKNGKWIVSLSLLTYGLPLVFGADLRPLPAAPSASVPDPTSLAAPESTALEEGKALYENGQLIAALGKFMNVLRNDPRNPDARQYLRMIVDTMRQNPAISAGKLGNQQQVVSTPAVQEEIRRMLQLRSRLSMDLGAIPGVQVIIQKNVNQVWVESSILFGDNSGGLKEQGIPILDRAAAWLKTYGQQPIIIHCYPEELQDAGSNGSLFLHRYSELFNFFAEERHLPSQRFVSADLLKDPSQAPGQDLASSSGTPHIIIETIGAQSAMLGEMPSASPGRGSSQWLENSITASRKVFNPEEGEWVNLDLASLSRMGLRDWTFSITPGQAAPAGPVYKIGGKGNLLKRLAWDGHDQKSGNFVAAGSYLAKLVSTNADGTIKSQEEILQVERTTKEEPVVVAKPKPKAKRHAKAKKPKVTPTASSPAVAPLTSSPAGSGRGPMVSPPETAGNDIVKAPGEDSKKGRPSVAKGTPAPPAADNSDSLIDAKPPSASASGQESGEDSAHAIWKQVIQFESGQSDLKPTVKASLERIGKTLEVYPKQKVRITGFAMSSEAGAKELAARRAETVRKILVEEYHVDSARVIVAGGTITGGENASKVEMSITN